MRVVENMEASLQVPTATSVRTIPVRTLEENRRLLNKHREAAGQGKVSFTHLVAWAILRAFDTFPRMNDAYAEVDGQAAPHPARPGAPRDRGGRAEEGRLAHAARPERQGRPEAQLRRVPEGLRRARGALAEGHDLARRLHGHDRLPHEPRHGGDDVLRAAPHARPGRDRRDRRPRLPGRVQVDGPAHAGAPRHQQGDDAHLHLRPPHHPGRGVGPLPRAHGGPAQGRGRLLRPRLRGPRPAAPAGEVGDGREPRALRDPRRARGGGEADEGPAAHPQLPGARAPRGRPRPARPRPRAAPRPRPRDLRAHAVGPRPRVPDRRALRRGQGRRCARSSTPCARPTAGRSASSTCTSPTPSARSGCSTAWSRRATTRPSTRGARSGSSRRSWRRRASSASSTRSTWATSASRSRAGRRSSRCSTASSTTRLCAGCARS